MCTGLCIELCTERCRGARDEASAWEWVGDCGAGLGEAGWIELARSGKSMHAWE